MSGLAHATPPSAGSRIDGLLRTRHPRRTALDRTMRTLAAAASVAILIPLVALVGYVVVRGLPYVTGNFLTRSAELYDEGGALGAILGTLQMVPLATLIAAPIGILGGVFVVEFAPPRLAGLVRLTAEVLIGIPSIVVGAFVFLVVVVPFGGFSAFAGIVALAIIQAPIILRSTDELLMQVPASAREAALALGMSRWRMVATVVLRAALGGIGGAVLLAIARAAGETAPILLTALGSQLVNVGDLSQPMDALPMFIYHGAALPSDTLIGQAWAAALLLLVLVLVTNLAVRAYTAGRTKGGSRA